MIKIGERPLYLFNSFSSSINCLQPRSLPPLETRYALTVGVKSTMWVISGQPRMGVTSAFVQPLAWTALLALVPPLDLVRPWECLRKCYRFIYTVQEYESKVHNLATDWSYDYTSEIMDYFIYLNLSNDLSNWSYWLVCLTNLQCHLMKMVIVERFEKINY